MCFNHYDMFYDNFVFLRFKKYIFLHTYYQNLCNYIQPIQKRIYNIFKNPYFFRKFHNKTNHILHHYRLHQDKCHLCYSILNNYIIYNFDSHLFINNCQWLLLRMFLNHLPYIQNYTFDI